MIECLLKLREIITRGLSGSPKKLLSQRCTKSVGRTVCQRYCITPTQTSRVSSIYSFSSLRHHYFHGLNLGHSSFIAPLKPSLSTGIGLKTTGLMLLGGGAYPTINYQGGHGKSRSTLGAVRVVDSILEFHLGGDLIPLCIVCIHS